MLTEWRKFRGWKVLEFFLQNPNTSIHIRGLARTLEVSPQTAQRYLKLYSAEGLLAKKQVANSSSFSLNNEDFAVKGLKKLWFLLLLRGKKTAEKVAAVNEGLNTLALYGAFASGEYTEESDVDFLVVCQGRELNLAPFKALEAKLRRKVEITKFSAGEWRSQAKKGSGFANSVLKNHVILFGAQL